MMGYIITGICCFAIGSITSVICVSLCCAGKTQDDTETPTDDCYGRFGASFGDCDRCPKNKGDKDEENTNS